MELNTTERRVLRRATTLLVAGSALRLICGPDEGSVDWHPPPEERAPSPAGAASPLPRAELRRASPAAGSPSGGGHRPAPDLAAQRQAVREATRKAERAAKPLSPGERIPVNSAPPEELQRLRGIGPVLAGRIVAERRKRGGFRRFEELLEVAGIGPKTLARIRHHITLR